MHQQRRMNFEAVSVPLGDEQREETAAFIEGGRPPRGSGGQAPRSPARGRTPTTQLPSPGFDPAGVRGRGRLEQNGRRKMTAKMATTHRFSTVQRSSA